MYEERLQRVFYENYIGSIVDWYAATLMREEPVIDLTDRSTAAIAGFLRPVRSEL